MNNTDNWFIVVNPLAAGGAVEKKWPRIRTLLQEYDLSYDFEITDHPGHAITITSKAIEKGYKKIMAIGGDGTNNEVVNGICLQKSVPVPEIIYALLPVGTGNDWIKMHNIPKNLELCIQACKKMNTRFQDVGLVKYHKNGEKQERYFANVAGMAYDAFLCEIAEKQKKRGLFNQFFYLLLVFKCLFKYNLRKARVIFDDQVIEDYFYIVNVGICKYSGGGMQTVPHAIPDDGLLALTICRRVSKLGVLLNTPRFYSGTLYKHPQITIHQVRSLRVEAVEGEDPTLVEVDGEFLGETPVEYSIQEKVLQIVVP